MPEASAKPAGTQTTKAQQQKGKDKNSAGAQENKAQRKARRAAKVSELGKSSNTPQEAITQARAQSQAKQCRAASGTSNASNVGGGSSNSLVNATVSNAISSLTAQSTAIHGSDILDKRVGLFKHLEITRRSGTADAAKDIHPVILALTLQFASYTVIGSSARCRATLRAFQKVIKDYRTPVGTTLSRNLTNHLSRQIDFLITARPLSITMGNAIRWLKQEISVVSIDVSDDQARESLIEKIETYIRDKIEVADRVIVQSAVKHIGNGDVILAFSRSAVVEQVFLEANLRGIEFSVVVVDTRPFYEGKEMVRRLARAGLKCEYVLISGLSYVLNDTTSVFLGAHAVLSNGQLYSRVGTALVAMSAKRKNVPVIVCCESIKFSNRVQLDSVTFNELDNNWTDASPGSPDELMNISIDPTPKPGPLKNWRDLPNLKLLNILYDLTPPEYIKKIVTEVGSLPPSSVPVIIREYNSA
ncbi:hypothetical protein V1519DRAFT_413459 [Lipomyces tetrasporus]